MMMVWNENKQIEAIPLFLRGKAKSQFETAHAANTFNSIQDVFKHLKEKNGVPKQHHIAAFMNRSIKVGESLTKYASVLNQMLVDGTGMDAETREQMVMAQVCNAAPEYIRPVLRASVELKTDFNKLLATLVQEISPTPSSGYIQQFDMKPETVQVI